MKYFPLLWSGLWCKRTRTLLTLASIVVAFLLFGLLQGVNAAFSHGVEESRLNRLYVQSRVSFTESLPLAQLSQIESVAGVEQVAYAHWFGGYYQDPKNFVFSYPVDADRFFSVYPEIELPPDQLKALINTRTGAVVGADLARTYGWKIGDHVPLKSQIWTHPGGNSDWEFDIVGIFEEPVDRSQEQSFYFNFKYFDEARAFGKGGVGWYVVQLRDADQGPGIAAAIDARFANSPDETKTQNEKEFTQSFLRQFGDINFLVNAIIGAVFFALLFLTGNTMMQSIRERIPDFAILKTLGFSDDAVLTLVLGEALLLCVTASLFGLAAATVTFPVMKSVVGVARLPPQVFLEGLSVAALLALVTGLPPALKVRRLAIIDSLSGR
jgi:putative ABC transport system permease protein